MSEDPTKIISYSKMSRFSKCPYSYHLYYVERVKPHLKSVNLVFGSAIHDTLAAWYDTPTLDAVSYFKAHWEELMSEGGIDFGKKDPNEMEALGIRMLNGYKSIIKKDLAKYEVIAIEVPFLIETEIFQMEGIIDLILKDKETGEIVIIDHKCLAKKMNEENLKIDLQFTFYVAGARSLGYDVSKCYLNALYKTKEFAQERISSDRSEDDLKTLYEDVYEIIQIKDTVKYKSRSFLCNSCDYFKWCLGNKNEYWVDKLEGREMNMDDIN